MTIFTAHVGNTSTAYKPVQNFQRTPAANTESYVNTRAYKEADHSKVRPLRESYVNQFNMVAENDKDAEKLLRDWAKPDSGGLFLAGLPDLNNPDAMRRHNRISQLFADESKKVESLKTELINSGRNTGKKPQEILKEVISLYDDQSEIYKTGKGWNGEVFAFDKFSPEGYERMLRYSSDVIDVRA